MTKCIHPEYTGMAQMRVSDWTKAKLDEIKEAEDHSSLDSVVKSLIKERENDAE